MFHGVVSYYNLVETCSLNLNKLAAFIKTVESGYAENPYHSRTHAADVVQGVCFTLIASGMGEKIKLTDFELFGAVIAAAIHDFEHPGVCH